MKSFVIILLSLLIISCGKNKEIKIVAKNAATGIPYAGLEYRIMSSRTGANGEKFRTEASGTLNENGEAMVNIRQKNRTYSVIVNEPENTCYNKQITQYFDSPYDVNGTFTFEFAECASLQRKVTNINCINDNDKIEILIKNQVNSLLSAPWILNGCADYTTTPTKVPIGIYILQWTVTKNNISNIYYDTFNLQENEIKLYEINY